MLDDGERTARIPDDDGAHRPPLLLEHRAHGNSALLPMRRVVMDAIRTMPTTDVGVPTAPGGPFARLGAARAVR